MRRDAAAAAVPGSLRNPGANGAARRQTGAADGSDQRIIRRCENGLGCGISAAVAGRNKQGLALGGEQHKNRIHGAGRRIESEGTTELLGFVVRLHPIEDVDGAIAFVHDDRGARSHGHGHVYVQGFFAVVSAGGRDASVPIQQYIRHHRAEQAGTLLVKKNVIREIRAELEQPDRLPDAGQLHTRGVGIAEVLAEEVTAGAGAGGE